MREDPNLNGAKTIACNVQQYVPLNAIKLKNLLEAANVSEREPVTIKKRVKNELHVSEMVTACDYKKSHDNL